MTGVQRGVRGEIDLAQYTRCARASSARVIAAYSTSFGMAARLLDRPTRAHVAAVYGLVRIADEIVDGAAAQAGLCAQEQRRLVDELETEAIAAIARGFSTNLVVHAFASTACEVGIGAELIVPFFDSMRRDLGSGEFDAAEVADYIYGSAEVVGLMCLRVFLRGRQPDAAARHRLEEGARRLGAAFQKVNFLRDLAADWEGLGRAYFPGVDPARLTEEQKERLVADIDADLVAARTVVPELPRDARAAVTAAHDLFRALNNRIRSMPAADLMTVRVRVPSWHKSLILGRAVLSRMWNSS